MADVTLASALEELLPISDSAGNAHMSDVIGNKADTAEGTSVVSLIKTLTALLAENYLLLEVVDTHFHAAGKCYPSLADGIFIAGGLTPWVLGDAVELLPINIIEAVFGIYYIEVEVTSANDIFEIVLYSDVECVSEIGRVRTSKLSNQTGVPDVPLKTSQLQANSGVWAKLASQIGGSNLTVSFFYHTY